MNYTIIDRDTWKRREYFEHYLKAVPCTYSMTVRLNITRLKQQGLKLYPTMLYLLTRTVNQYEQFRTSFRENGDLVIYSDMHPSYTIFHKDTETFSCIWTEYSSDYNAFCRSYEQDMLSYGTVEAFNAKPDTPENCFDVSMIPHAGIHSSAADFHNGQILRGKRGILSSSRASGTSCRLRRLSCLPVYKHPPGGNRPPIL